MPALKVSLAGAAALALFSTMPTAKADAWDQKTTFNFSKAVEVPGRVLPAGSYVFKLADSPSNRQIVQIFAQDEKHVLGTFLTIPEYRLKPASRPTISFQERAAGSPEAVLSWFYPGQNYGHQFLYAKAAPVVAQATPAPAPLPAVVTEKTEPAVEAAAPVIAETKPAPATVETAALRPEVVGEVAEVVAVEEVSDASAGRLPSTASSTPLVGLLGLLSLAAAGVLRRALRAEQ